MHILCCMSIILGTTESKMWYAVKNCQQQKNSYDCGVFAIAFATSLAFDQDPCDIVYDTKCMRNHLLLCFEKEELSPFPTLSVRPQRNSRDNRETRELAKSIEVYCHCRRIEYSLPTKDQEKWAMVQCTLCKEWFHRMCEKVPKRTAGKWLCKICKKKNNSS